MRPLIIALLFVTAGLAGCASPETTGPSTVTEDILVRAGDGLEWKLHIRSGDTVRYEWTATGPLFFDLHGEPDGAAPDEFTSHKIGDNDADGGELTAPFTGRHGWYWENQGDQDVRLRITVTGDFDVVGFV